jgi:hypothetical protein
MCPLLFGGGEVPTGRAAPHRPEAGTLLWIDGAILRLWGNAGLRRCGCPPGPDSDVSICAWFGRSRS